MPDEAQRSIERGTPDALVSAIAMPLFQQSHDAVVVRAFDGTIRAWNASAEALYGYSRDEAIGANFHALLGTPRALVEAMEAALRETRRWEGELVHVGRDGRSLVVASRQSLLEHEGRTLVLETAHESTARRADEARRASEDRLDLALEAARMVAWEWDLETDQTVLSSSAESVLGATADRGIASAAEGFAWVHPEDRARHEGIVRDAIARGDAYRSELRVVRPDGRVLWMEDRGRVTCDATGRPVRMSGVIMDVTERVEARRTAERLAHIAQATPDFVAIGTADGKVVFINEAGRRMVGIPEDADVGSYEQADLTAPWAYAKTRDEWMPLALRDGTVSGEGALLTRDGREIPVSFVLVVRRHPDTGAVEHVSTIARDLSERKRTEDALRRSEDRFRLAAEAVNGIIYDADLRTGHVERTRGLFEVLGHRPEDVPPNVEWWQAQIHPDDVPRMQAEGTRALEEGRSETRLEYRVRHADGHWVHLLDRAILERDASGTPVRQVGSSVDVTQVREAEHALREADRRKDEFLAMLAHELRNPLAAIHNAVELGHVAPAGSAESERVLETIERQVAHLTRMVDDLLDVSRITQDKITLRKERALLATVVDRAVETTRGLLELRRQRLTASLPPRPVYLHADVTRLAQVLSNLLSNASKYSDRGTSIELSATVDESRLILRVKDDGIGIPPDILPHVFDLFVQADRSLDRAQGGLGIGLTLVRRLVELHGGSVEVRSEGQGRGTEVRIELPADEVSSPTIAATEAPAPRAAGQRVLVVDDNVDAAESLAWALELQGHDVLTAHDGPAALRAVEKHRPSVVLLDIGLPGMDGYEVARRLRDRADGRGMLLVALTGYGRDEDRARALEAGFDRHFVKPVALAELHALLGSR